MLERYCETCQGEYKAANDFSNALFNVSGIIHTVIVFHKCRPANLHAFCVPTTQFLVKIRRYEMPAETTQKKNQSIQTYTVHLFKLHPSDWTRCYDLVPVVL